MATRKSTTKKVSAKKTARKKAVSKPKSPPPPTPKVAIVASLFNRDYVDSLIAKAAEILTEKEYSIILERVPGSFEIPLAVKKVIHSEKPDVVIAFGLIWQGATAHADLVASEVTHALMNLSLECDTPILHQVLSVETKAQAKARCSGKKLNRGTEAAEAAVFLIEGETPPPDLKYDPEMPPPPPKKVKGKKKGISL